MSTIKNDTGVETMAHLTCVGAGRAEIDAIAGNKAPPTFANTIEALEQTGQMTSRVLAYYFIWTNTLASPEVQKVEEAVEPLLAAHQDAILQNAALFRRIDAVYADGAGAGLTPEQSRLTWLHHTRFDPGKISCHRINPADGIWKHTRWCAGNQEWGL